MPRVRVSDQFGGVGDADVRRQRAAGGGAARRALPDPDLLQRRPASGTRRSTRGSPRSRCSGSRTTSTSTRSRSRRCSPTRCSPGTTPWCSCRPPATCSTTPSRRRSSATSAPGGGYVGIHSAADTEYAVAVVRPARRRLLPQPPERHAGRDRARRGHLASLDEPLAEPVAARGRVVQLPGDRQPGCEWWRDGLQPAQQRRPRAAEDGRVDVRRGRRQRRGRRRSPDRVVPPLRRRPRLVHGHRPHGGHVRRAERPPAHPRRPRGRCRRGRRPAVRRDVSSARPATSAARCRARCRCRWSPSASLGAFTPGVAKDYVTTLAANVISTGGEATLSVADPSPTATGRLVNGAFALPRALQLNATARRSGRPVRGAERCRDAVRRS